MFFETRTTGGYQYMGYNGPTLVRLRFLTRSAAEGERFLLKFVRILNAGCWKIRSRGTKIRRFCFASGRSLFVYFSEVPEKRAGLKLQQLQVENLLSIWCVPIVEGFEGNYHGCGDGNDDESDVVSCSCATAF